MAEIGYNVFDFETEQTSTDATEAAANSIINVKTLSFKFYTESRFINEYTEFFKTVVLPYLKQMVPSTAIWEYEIIKKDQLETSEVWFGDPIAILVDGVAYGDGDSGTTIMDEDADNDFITNFVESHDINVQRRNNNNNNE